MNTEEERLIVKQERELEKVNTFYLQKEAEVLGSVETIRQLILIQSVAAASFGDSLG